MSLVQITNLRAELQIIDQALNSFEEAEIFPETFMALIDRKIEVKARIIELNQTFELVGDYLFVYSDYVTRYNQILKMI